MRCFARGAVGRCYVVFAYCAIGYCNGCRLPGAETGRLDRQGFQIPHRRDHAGAAAALHHGRRADRPAGAGAARFRRLGGQHADAGLRGELFGAGQPLDASKYYIIIPDGDRPRQIVKAVRRHEDGVSEIRLRRHGRCTISPGQGRPRHQASAACDRQFDGRHAHLDLGREISRA